jgi:hypothetical protein
LADAIARDIAAIVRMAGQSGCFIVDPFVGSGNTLFWLLRHLPASRGLGFELDPQVFALSRHNLHLLGSPVEIRQCDYLSAVDQVVIPPRDLVTPFLAPPWGEALSPTTGLDLRRTEPPITDVVDALSASVANPLLCSIQVFETVDLASKAEVESRFDWSQQRIYEFNAPGANHGLLLGTSRWRPGTQE